MKLFIIMIDAKAKRLSVYITVSIYSFVFCCITCLVFIAFDDASKRNTTNYYQQLEKEISELDDYILFL